MAPPAQRICVAQIGAPHGVRGEVRLRTFTADPLAVGDYGVLESADGRTRFEIASLRAANDRLIARLKGIDDRDAAARLTGVELYVPRDRLPAPAADEFYHADLIGLAVVASDGQPLGKVAAIHNFGGGDLIEVTTQCASVLMPFTQATVPGVDIAAGRLTVDAAAFAAAAAPAGAEDERSSADEHRSADEKGD